MIKHGTASGYTYWNCRCESCHAAFLTYCRDYRIRRQYADDVDEIAVERAARGDRSISLTRAEVRQVFLYLNSHGYSVAQIADRMGISRRTVHRWRLGWVKGPYARRSTVPNSKREAA